MKQTGFTRLVSALLLVMLFSLSAAAVTHLQVRFLDLEKSKLQLLLRSGLDLIPPADPAQPEAVVTAEELRDLQLQGYHLEIIHADLEGFYRSRMTRDRNYGAYHTYSEGIAEIQQLHNDFPGIVGTPIVLGQTLLGNDIWAVKISDNPEVDEDEPEVFYNAYIHAREAITIEVLLYFMHYLTDNYGSDPRVTSIVDGRELWFVPFMNPDGVLYNEATDPDGGGMWRKNRRNNGDGSYGVDPNRNWGYMWGYDDEGSSPNGSSETYRGTAAFSEPCTQVIRDFVNSRHFANAITYHSYSNLYIYPWSYDEIYTEDHDIFTTVTGTMSQSNGYTCGTSWELLYAVNGDTDDWFYGGTDSHDKILAITTEVGGSSDGFWPPESRITPLCQENLEPNLYWAEIAGNIWNLGPPATPVLNELGEVGADYLLTWSTPDPDPQNPAVDYEVWEMTGASLNTDDFETRTDGWEAGTQSFILDTGHAHSGTYSYWAGAAISTNFISTLAEQVSVTPGMEVTFWTWYDIETEWDYAYLEISTDGGGTWTTLEGNITTTANSNGNNDGYGITGNSGGWVQGIFSLAAYNGQSVSLRLRYETDYSVLNEGIFVDDFYPVPGYANQVMLASGVTNEYYQITGQSPGYYSYKVRARDAQDDYSNFSNVITVHSLGGEDETPPLVVHTPLPDTQDSTGPWTVTAEITDYSGVASASVEYQVNDGPWYSVPMTSTRETWSGQIPGPAAPGSVIQYQITATDASSNANNGVTGPWSFQILMPQGLEYCQDFAAGFADFTVETYEPGGNTWVIATEAGHGNTAFIQYSSSSQEDHAALISPVFDCTQQGTLELSFWHHLKMGYSGYWSHAWVRGSTDGGATWNYLLAEWHYDDQPGEFEVEGTETLDLTAWAAGEAQVRIMFEYQDLYDWWWYVDDVCLNGTLIVTPDPAVIAIQIEDQDVILSWEPAAGATSYDVYHASEAYGPFTFLGNVVDPNFLHLGAAVSKGFYRVVSRNDPARVSGNIPTIDPGLHRRVAERVKKREE